MTKKLIYSALSFLFLGMASQAAQPGVYGEGRVTTSDVDYKTRYAVEFSGIKYTWHYLAKNLKYERVDVYDKAYKKNFNKDGYHFPENVRVYTISFEEREPIGQPYYPFLRMRFSPGGRLWVDCSNEQPRNLLTNPHELYDYVDARFQSDLGINTDNGKKFFKDVNIDTLCSYGPFERCLIEAQFLHSNNKKLFIKLNSSTSSAGTVLVTYGFTFEEVLAGHGGKSLYYSPASAFPSIWGAVMKDLYQTKMLCSEVVQCEVFLPDLLRLVCEYVGYRGGDCYDSAKSLGKLKKCSESHIV